MEQTSASLQRRANITWRSEAVHRHRYASTEVYSESHLRQRLPIPGTTLRCVHCPFPPDHHPSVNRVLSSFIVAHPAPDASAAAPKTATKLSHPEGWAHRASRSEPASFDLRTTDPMSAPALRSAENTARRGAPLLQSTPAGIDPEAGIARQSLARGSGCGQGRRYLL